MSLPESILLLAVVVLLALSFIAAFLDLFIVLPLGLAAIMVLLLYAASYRIYESKRRRRHFVER